MKWAEMQRVIAAERDAVEAAIARDPGFVAARETLVKLFGAVQVEAVALPGPVRGQPIWVKGGPLGAMAEAGQLTTPPERCFVERWDRNCWGFGPTPEQMRERAELERQAIERGRKPKATRATSTSSSRKLL